MIRVQRIEGEGVSCVFAHAAVPARMARDVETVWYSEGALAASNERVLPCGLIDVVANLGDAMRLVEGVGDARIVGGCTSGMLQRHEVIGHPAVHRAVGIRLRPLGARRLLNLPLAGFSGTLTSLDALLGSAGSALADRCAHAKTPAAALDAALAWIDARFALATAPDPVAPWALARLDRPDPPRTIASLVAASGLSERRFVQRFQRELGVTPRVYARLVRFRRALRGLRPGVTLATVAVDAGYFDHAHMDREFRDLGGLTPSAVLRGRYESGLTVAG